MSPETAAVRAGVERGRIELRQGVTGGQDVWGVIFFPAIALLVMYMLRGNTVPGTAFSLGSQAIPGILAMNVMLNGLTGLAMVLTMDKEDGTLLRAKATPNGMLGYVTGKLVSRAGISVVGLLLPLIPAGLLFGGLELGRASSWLTLAWVVALGLVAILPIGMILGSLFEDSQSMSIITLPMMVLLAISGVFYPLTAFPEWLQWVAQVFPLYWLGLGLRSALLPEALAVAEVGGSWRHLETVAVLGVWAIVGLLAAPPLLRRMARRVTGASLAARSEPAGRRQT